MSLGAQAARGAAWTVVSSVLARALGLAGTLLLVHWVAPDDYGVVSAASVVVATVSQLSTLNIGIYLIAHPDEGRAAAFHATVLHMTTGVLAFFATLAVAPAVGPWLDAPGLARFVPILAVAALCDRVGYVPERVLVRNLSFGTVSVARTASELVYTGVSVTLAIKGWGGASVMWGNLARSSLRALLLVVPTPRREWLDFMRPRLSLVARLARYGFTVSIGNLAGFASRRWDNLLVSRFYGPEAMGLYNLAYNLADIPAVQVGEQVTDVLFASLPKVTPERRLDVLVRALRLLALLLFPLAIGLAAIAPTLGDAFLNPRWSMVSPMLMALSALSLARPLELALAGYLLAQGRPRTATALEWIGLGLVLAMMATVGRFGRLAICSAVAAGFVLRVLVDMVYVSRRDHVPLARLLAPTVAPLLACVPMVLAVVAARAGLRAWHLDAAAPHAARLRCALRLCLEVVCGATVYALAAWLVAREAARDLLALARRARHERIQGPPPASTVVTTAS